MCPLVSLQDIPCIMGILMAIQPIDRQQRRQVRDEADLWRRRAEVLCGVELPPIAVTFDLRGRAAGQYRVRDGYRSIRFNPYIFARYFDDSLAVTVPHEVAHYAVDVLYGAVRVRPHGEEWRAVMGLLGVDARASGCYDLSGMPVRRQRRFRYRCDCRTHELTTCRHNRIVRGQAVYHCRRCGAELIPHKAD